MATPAINLTLWVHEPGSQSSGGGAQSSGGGSSGTANNNNKSNSNSAAGDGVAAAAAAAGGATALSSASASVTPASSLPAIPLASNLEGSETLAGSTGNVAAAAATAAAAAASASSSSTANTTAPGPTTTAGDAGGSGDTRTPYQGIPLASHVSSEIIINPDLLKNETLGLELGDVAELIVLKHNSGRKGARGEDKRRTRRKDKEVAANGTATALGGSGGAPGLGSEGAGNDGTNTTNDPGARDPRDPKPHSSFVFRIEKNTLAKESQSSQLQISVSQALSQAFGLKNRDQIALRKLPSPLPHEYVADHIELYFKDQYLGRADMNRISLALASGNSVYLGQVIQLAGLNIKTRVGGLWSNGKTLKSALINADTRTVYRSESAKYYIFIQLSTEMWQFDEDGSLFFEKVVDLFLPELFSRWERKGTNHIVSIVLFSRILYEQDEVDYVTRPLMKIQDEQNIRGAAYTDVYKVVVDLDADATWSEVLRSLRAEFHNFRQEVLLASEPRPDGKLAGTISASHEGGVLEAINMALSAFDKHYVDRDLQRTGLSIVVITAGTSHFNVDKNLLRLTAERMIDDGFGVDCVSLAKMPLHAVPLFRYTGSSAPPAKQVRSRPDRPTKSIAKPVDYLYLNDSQEDAASKDTFYAIPHWVDTSFYAKHQDKPFRCDRFLPRCRMPAIQNIGIGEYENASIALPFLREETQYLPRLVAKESNWQELSEREKRHKIWAKFDEIACGAKGKWEIVDLSLIGKDEDEAHIRASPRERTGLDSPAPRQTASASTSLTSSSTTSTSEGSHTAEESTSTALGLASAIEQGRESRRHAKPPPITLPEAPALPRTRKETVRKPPSVSQEQTPMPTPKTTPIKLPLSTTSSNGYGHPAPRSPGRTASRPGMGRLRADSTASSSTLSRQTSHLSLRSPSVAPVTYTQGAVPVTTRDVSAAPADRRAVSSSSSVTAIERSSASTSSASNVLSSLLASQSKKAPPSKATSTASTTAASIGSWLWNRKSKAAPAVSKDTTLVTVNEGPSSDQPPADSKSKQLAKRPPSPAGSVASRKSSATTSSAVTNTSLRTPFSHLSLTPATPASAKTSTGPAATTTVTTKANHQLAKPISIPPTPAAFKVATNDPMMDPHSLEESSMQQYFFEAARNNLDSRASKALKAKVEAARKQRADKFNPCNPTRSTGMLEAQSRRWINIFPRAGKVNNQRSIKWKSLCTPACLPLYTDYLPPVADLDEAFTKETYTLPVTLTTSSFLVRQGSNMRQTAGNLLRELVNQRLAQSCQIIMPQYSDVWATTLIGPDYADKFRLPSAYEVADILFNTPEADGKSIYLGSSNRVHQLRYDRHSSCIVVTIWKEIVHWKTNPVEYSFMLSPLGTTSYIDRSVTFSYPDQTTYDWKYTDRLIAGVAEPKLAEKTRYWRTRFILIPADVPDLQGMIQSQKQVLFEDSTEEDLRIAGVMNLYEQFSKARWLPANRDATKPKMNPLFYSSTILDPSLFALHEADRLRLESNTVPLPEAYDVDQFYEDLGPKEVVKLILDGPRPMHLQPRRRGFRTIEDTFTGEDLITWLKNEFVDIPDRATALSLGNELVVKGVVQPLNPPKRLVDNYSFYVLAPEYARKRKAPQTTWLTQASEPTNGATKDNNGGSAGGSVGSNNGLVKVDSEGRIIVSMSHSIIINLDPSKKSDRAETAFLHFDVAHNTANGFHFQLEWLGTARMVEDMLAYWQRMAEKYGLKLVEENVRQIKDIALDNPLQAPEQIRLALPPPVIQELPELLGPTVVSTNYFETQLLKSLGYILDVEADSNFSSNLHAEYSYRKTPFEYSQFIHRSGTCFVQCLGGEQGYLFLKNRLYLSHRNGSSRRMKSKSSRQQSHNLGGKGGVGGGSNGLSPLTAFGKDPLHDSSAPAGSPSHPSNNTSWHLNDATELKHQLIAICNDPSELERRWREISNAVFSSATSSSSATNTPLVAPTAPPGESLEVKGAELDAPKPYTVGERVDEGERATDDDGIEQNAGDRPGAKEIASEAKSEGTSQDGDEVVVGRDGSADAQKKPAGGAEGNEQNEEQVGAVGDAGHGHPEEISQAEED